MAFKRALVVDDSQLARISLKKQLEEHGLVVELAESGEAALEYLDHKMVDVIFMDHMMPGMDGLEAVSAIKNNPRTATIPVMMYTTKEGEVYVGRARALGAVGVLSKQVHPGVLFDMLLKLGLVKDKRVTDEPVPDNGPDRRAAFVEDDLDREYDQQAMSMSVQALVSRILEDQHLVLRADMLRSNREFAKQVAVEIIEEQHEDQRPAKKKKRHADFWMAFSAVMTAAVMIVFGLFWQARGEREAALAQVQKIATAERALALSNAENLDLQLSYDNERYSTNTRYAGLVDTLEWAVNLDASMPFERVAFDDSRAELLETLLGRLSNAGFEGTLRLEAHLGRFCLVIDDSGAYRLADALAPVESCSVVGHPLGNSTFVSERQSVSFANFLSASPLVNGTGIEVEVIAHDRLNSVDRFPHGQDATTAGEWNRVAEMNNRVEISFIQ